MTVFMMLRYENYEYKISNYSMVLDVNRRLYISITGFCSDVIVVVTNATAKTRYLKHSNTLQMNVLYLTMN